MPRPFADTFGSLKEPVLRRLVEVRDAIDVTQIEVPETMAQEQYAEMLDRMGRYLEGGDRTRYAEYIERWLALRMGDGATPESLIHTTVAVCDVIAQIARVKLPSEMSTTEFVREIQRLSLQTAKVIVERVCDEVDRLREHDTLKPEGAR